VASRRDFMKGAAMCGASMTAGPLLRGQTAGPAPLQTIKLSQNRQLFIDSYLIEEEKGVRQTPQEGTKYEQNPVMRAEQPWEKSVVINSGGPAVLYDSQARLFRMLYFTYGATFGTGKGLNESFIPSYATSTDGIHWQKPNLGLVEYGGSTQSSILPWPSQMQMGSTNVIYDPRDPDPERRYKSVYYSSQPSMRFDAGPQAILTWNAHRQDNTTGLFVSFSPDELHWHDYPGNPVLDRHMVHDTHSLLGWDERAQKYIGYFRPALGNHRPSKTVDGKYAYASSGDVRVIGRSESSDFIHWTEPSQQIVLRPDSKDEPGTEFYCMAAMFYEDYYLGLLWIYHNDPYWPWPKGTTITDDKLGRMQQTIDAQLVTSRDGIHWERTAKRTPVIPLGPLGSWDDSMIFASTPVVVDDEVWAYYGGTNMRHTGESLGSSGEVVNGVRRTMGIGLAKWRLDGFVALEPEHSEGTVLTRPISFSGDQLWLNADASKGSVEVEVLDENRRPVPGLTRADAIPLKTAAVRQQVGWGANAPSLGTLAGRTVRLKFYLRNAKLYSFWISSKA
jgi:hypothetical protein